MIVTTSCTGVMIPSVDAYLVEQMRMRSDVMRLPITELGCAAGAAAMSRAREHVRAYPEHTVLVMSIELPSLTFQKEDLSMTNLVAAAIFGDGAAACVVRGERAPGGLAQRARCSSTRCATSFPSRSTSWASSSRTAASTSSSTATCRMRSRGACVRSSSSCARATACAVERYRSSSRSIRAGAASSRISTPTSASPG